MSGEEREIVTTKDTNNTNDVDRMNDMGRDYHQVSKAPRGVMCLGRKSGVGG